LQLLLSQRGRQPAMRSGIEDKGGGAKIDVIGSLVSTWV
jgi:hypothetical protein